MEEEPQRRAGEVHAGVARAERGEMELEASEILGLGPVRGATEEECELPDLADVVALGVLAELADGHVLNHPPAQRRDGVAGHGKLPSEGEAAKRRLELPRERFSPMAHLHLSGHSSDKLDTLCRAARRVLQFTSSVSRALGHPDLPGVPGLSMLPKWH